MNVSRGRALVNISANISLVNILEIHLSSFNVFADEMMTDIDVLSTLKGANGDLAATSKMRKVAVAVSNCVLKVQGGE